MISKKDLVGTWQLESWSVGYSDREDFTSPFGDNPEGLLMYSGDDWMSASIGRSDRQTLPGDISFRKIPEEKLALAYLSYFHYAGRYRVVEGDVIHYVTQSLNPNFVGTEQLRHAELDGQTLVLSGRDKAADGVVRLHSLVWHKLSAVD
ncbi:MAG: lipocalin-like domain-containing protein [Chromatocurvus sp.]